MHNGERLDRRRSGRARGRRAPRSPAGDPPYGALPRADRRRARLRRMGARDCRRELARGRGLLPGAPVPVSAGGDLRSAGRRPVGTASGADRTRLRLGSPARARWATLLRRPHGRAGRRTARAVRAGGLLRRAAAEDVAGIVLQRCTVVPAGGIRAAPQPEPGARHGRPARWLRAHAREQPDPRTARGAVGLAGARPRATMAPDRRAADGRRLDPRTRRSAQPGNRRALPHHHLQRRTELLHRQQSHRERDVQTAAQGTGQPRLRARRCARPRRACARTPTRSRRGLELLAGQGTHLRPRAAGRLATPARAQVASRLACARAGRHRQYRGLP